MKFNRTEIKAAWAYAKAAAPAFIIYVAVNGIISEKIPIFPVGILFGVVSTFLLDRHFSGLAKDVVNDHDTRAGRKA